jgi:hypothetical protein
MALRLFARLDDRLNPIVVKELRQAVQSKFVTSVLVLFLMLQLVILGVFLVTTGVERIMENPDYAVGRRVFVIFQSILLGTCMLFIPGYTCARLSAERANNNVDLLFITTLRPRAIVGGKFLAALILAVLVFSACAPFMTFTYLLRGIDVPSILLVLAADFLAVAGAVQVLIFLAVVPGHNVAKAILGILGLIGLVYYFVGVLLGTFEIIDRGVATTMDTKEFWAAVGAIAVGAGSVTALFFTWSVALLSPPSANRAWPVRVCLLAVWLATGLTFGTWSRVLNASGPLKGWVVFMGVLVGLGLTVAVSERDHWGLRVARTIPRRWWLRGPAFLIYSGAAGGLAFALLLFGLGWLNLVWWVNAEGQSWGWAELRTTMGVMGMLLLYTLCYALTTALFRSVLPLGVRPGHTWSLMVFLVAVGGTVPFLLSFFLFFRNWNYDSHYYWLLSNPLAAALEVPRGLTSGKLKVFYTFAGCWAGVVALLNGPWLVRQVARFRPYAADAPMVLEEADEVVVAKME